MKKRTVTAVITAAMLFAHTGAFANGFTDIPDNWANDAINYAIENGMLKGDGDRIYPDRSITRAEMAAILVRALELSDKADISGFADVNKSDWYYDIMAAAVEAGIYKGNGERLNPSDNITREEAFAVIARAYGISGSGRLSGFKDTGEVSDWAVETTAALIENGVVSGSGDEIRPKGLLTRAEAAQLLYNIEIKNLIYGTVDMSFAEFFLGELSDEQTDAALALYESEDYYDAVSSATTAKAAMFTSDIVTTDEAAGTTVISGIKDVPVAINKDLYAAAMSKIEAGETGGIYSAIARVRNVTDTMPAAYKLLRAGGLYSGLLVDEEEIQVKTKTVTADTASVFGDYVIKLDEGITPDPSVVTCMIITTDTGKKYGLRPSNNIYRKTYEFGFSVGIRTSEPHGNSLEYKAFQDIEGASITGIRYITNENGVFKAYDITGFDPIFLKHKLRNGESIAVEDISVTGEGQTAITRKIPNNADYSLISLSVGGKNVTFAEDKDNGVLHMNPDSLRPGKYTAVFEDDVYENISAEFIVDSELSGTDIRIEDGQIVIDDENYNPVDYVSAITSVTIGGTEYKPSGKRGNAVRIFNDDGAVLREAELDGRRIFEPEQSYKLTIKADGYETVTLVYDTEDVLD